MRRKITSLTTAISVLFLMLITWPETVLGQEKGYTSVYTLDGTTPVSSASAYGDHSFTQNNYDWHAYGNLTTNPWRIGLAKGSTNTTKDCPIYSQTAISDNITKIIITHGGTGNVTVNSMIVTIHSSSEDAATGNNAIATYDSDDITFVANGSVAITKSGLTSWAGKFYRIVYNITSDGLSNKAHYLEFESAVFYKTTYTITYDANGATEGSVPDATTHDAGSDATVANNTGSLVRTGFMFSGWNTQTDGEGTDYAAGVTINNIAQDYTLYAKWTSASTPNIVVSGDDISNNTLNLVYTESGDKTATASYNNMPSGYSNAEVALYNDLECTEAFGGDWFSASLNESDKTEIDYSANANIGVARTVYMRVSAVYDEITYYSNVITVTQAALPCTVTYNKNDEGASGTMSDGDSPYAYGSTVTVLANGFTAPTGKVFYKWNTKADASGQWYEANDTFEITENTTLYAQWNDIPKYVYVTSLSQVIPGKHYILASSITKDTKADVMDAQNGSTYRDKKTTTTYIAEGDVDGDGNDDIYIQEDGLYEFVISGDMSVEISEETYISYTIYDKTNKGYLCNSGSTNLSVNTTAINDASRWVLEFWKDTNDDIRLKIRNVDVTGNYLQYNPSSPRYKTYTGSQKHPFLYMKYDDNDCEIYSATTLSKNESYTNLTIVKDTYVNGSVTVPNNKTLNVSGTLTNNGTAANLVIEDGGQLITNSCIPLTYKKNITSATKDGGWYTISTPVHTSSNTFLEHESVENLILAPEQYDFFYYDEPSHYWRNYKKHKFDLNVGQGYLYRNNGAELHFAGNNNQATYYEKDLSYASTEPSLLGFNLIGNPYPQNITMSDVTVNNEGTLTGGYVLSNAGAWSADVAATIAPAQGFLVQIDKAGVTARITKPTGGSKSRANHDYLKFIVANSQYEDAAYALFDKGYGLNKIDHRNADIPMLYIPKDKQNFAIATMSDDTKSFNLNLKAMTTGKYTLSYKATGTYSYLHVIDRLTGEDVDMLLEGEYSFIASPSDAENRFIVRLEYSAGSEGQESSVFAYQSGNDIIVNGEGELQIFDMMGRRVSTQYVSGVETINLQLNGVYVFRLNEKTQKIVVK